MEGTGGRGRRGGQGRRGVNVDAVVIGFVLEASHPEGKGLFLESTLKGGINYLNLKVIIIFLLGSTLPHPLSHKLLPLLVALIVIHYSSKYYERTCASYCFLCVFISDNLSSRSTWRNISYDGE